MFRSERLPRRHPATFFLVRRALSPGIALALAATAPACGGSADFAKELDSLRSWTASVQLAAEQRRVHATTATYTSRLREKAGRALDAQRRTLAAAAHSAADRERARSAADSLERAIRLLGAEAHP